MVICSVFIDGYKSVATVEDALARRWGSCSYNCSSVYGNAPCVPDAFRCDDEADCLEEEDEEACDHVGDAGGTDDCPTLTCDLPATLDPICVPHHQICDGYPDCAAGEDEQGCGNAGGASTQATTTSGVSLQTAATGKEVTRWPTWGQEPQDGLTTEPTSGQETFEDQTVGGFHESHGSHDQAMIWMVAAALCGQILYDMIF
ncbi:CD320 antigen-like [Branchiostoma lanceolatum]|uniref:CD320 antigen-like n=1 Tax=Branchiostoma lanceolatum TaxID=7740 RepID=UPI003456AABD